MEILARVALSPSMVAWNLDCVDLDGRIPGHAVAVLVYAWLFTLND